jgi:hypothetical protein
MASAGAVFFLNRVEGICMMCLCVQNVPRHWGDSHLRRLFGRFGVVERIVFTFDRSQQPSTCAFVDMTADAASAARLALHGRRIRGDSRLHVKFFTTG